MEVARQLEEEKNAALVVAALVVSVVRLLQVMRGDVLCSSLVALPCLRLLRPRPWWRCISVHLGADNFKPSTTLLSRTAAHLDATAVLTPTPPPRPAPLPRPLPTAPTQRAAEERDAAARAAFDKAAERLHHLVSTRAIPGVYNPPAAASAAAAGVPGAMPTAFNVPVEAHLKHATVRLLRTAGYAKAAAGTAGGHSLGATTGSMNAVAAAAGIGADGAVTVLGNTRAHVVPSYVSTTAGSLQNAVPYHVIDEERSRERRVSTLMNLSPKPWQAGNKRTVMYTAPPPESVHAAVTYREPWLAGRSTKELDNTAEARAKRVSAQAFVVPYAAASGTFEAVERRRMQATMTALASWDGGGGVVAGTSGTVGGARSVTTGPGGLRTPATVASTVSGSRVAGRSAAAASTRGVTAATDPSAYAVNARLPAAGSGGGALSRDTHGAALDDAYGDSGGMGVDVAPAAAATAAVVITMAEGGSGAGRGGRSASVEADALDRAVVSAGGAPPSSASALRRALPGAPPQPGPAYPAVGASGSRGGGSRGGGGIIAGAGRAVVMA